MTGVIEALHIFDEHKRAILSHTYNARPLSAAHLLPLYLDHPTPRPNLIYLSNTNPPTLVFSLTHANLLYLATTSSEIEPLLVLEFLHRIIDVLEEFLGAPVLAHKIEANYDVVAQLLNEMCDAGMVNTTEPNALRDAVEVEGLLGKFLGSLNLPNKSGLTPSLTTPSIPSFATQNAPSLPWRRANVRHTSNELYADVVESLTVTLAPSGRPIAAFANGTIAFTSKVSGVPDITMSLTGREGKHNLGNVMELPVFHPCVRLNRWRESPGELSFVPPDGRFILAGYEVDLLPFSKSSSSGLGSNNLQLPISLEVKTGLGPAGSDFDIRLNINRIPGGPGSLGPSGRGGASGGRAFGGPHSGTVASPSLHDVVVTVPLPSEVRNLSDMRPSKGDANYNPGDKSLEWHIPQKELTSGTPYYSLKATVLGPLTEEDTQDDPTGFGFGKDYSYEEPYQSTASPTTTKQQAGSEDDKDAKRIAQNKILMPSSASVSFSVKGWIPSGIKIESINLDTKKSRGLGEGVKPYKGVKYLTISKGGVRAGVRRFVGLRVVPRNALAAVYLTWLPQALSPPQLELGSGESSQGTWGQSVGNGPPLLAGARVPIPALPIDCTYFFVALSIRWRTVMAMFSAPLRRRAAAGCRIRPGHGPISVASRTLQVTAVPYHLSSPVASCRHGSSTTEAKKQKAKTAIFFPGQGVQKVGMTSPWIEAFPRAAHEVLDEIDTYMGYKLSTVIQDGPSSKLTATPNAQPAIMATSILILRILEREFGFKLSERIDVSLGHSLGEFAALVAAGVLAFPDALYMVRKRAEAMAEATRRAQEEFGGEYGMVAVVTEPEYLASLIEAIDDFVGYRSAGARSDHAEDIQPIDQVLIANINSKNQIVLSGNVEKIKELVAHVRQFLGHDPRAVRLNSDSPFHSPIMRPAVSVMKDLLSGKSRVAGRESEDVVTFPGDLMCISNVSANPFGSKEEVKDLLSRQCLETVRWWESIKYLDQEQRVRRWLGIGPGKVGRNLVGKEVGMRGMDKVKGGGVWAITDPWDVEDVLRALELTEDMDEGDD